MNHDTDFSKLIEIMNDLREKCPWDKKQTIHTLRQQTIEETFELAEEITGNNWEGIQEELGDLLLHIIFYAKIAEEQQAFTLQDVINSISEKLIKRHPHIYGNVKVNDEEDVKKNWEQLKLAEGKKSIMSGVPRSLPAMVKAMRIQEKAKQVGFEWANKEQVWEKVKEEEKELMEAVTSGNPAEIEAEAGDLFFSVINYARFLKIDSENALELTNRKFLKRFLQMEDEAQKMGLHLQDMTLEEMDAIWNSIKNKKTGLETDNQR